MPPLLVEELEELLEEDELLEDEELDELLLELDDELEDEEPEDAAPELELLLEDELDELSVSPVSNWPGTLTRKASTREPPALLVQMKYLPVTSRLPLGSLL